MEIQLIALYMGLQQFPWFADIRDRNLQIVSIISKITKIEENSIQEVFRPKKKGKPSRRESTSQVLLRHL